MNHREAEARRRTFVLNSPCLNAWRANWAYNTSCQVKVQLLAAGRMLGAPTAALKSGVFSIVSTTFLAT